MLFSPYCREFNAPGVRNRKFYLAPGMRNGKICLAPNDSFENVYLAVKGLNVKSKGIRDICGILIDHLDCLVINCNVLMSTMSHLFEKRRH